MNGLSSQDRATCLGEAAAAFEQAKRDKLDEAVEDDYFEVLVGCHGRDDFIEFETAFGPKMLRGE
jgi:hypothetical protein